MLMSEAERIDGEAGGFVLAEFTPYRIVVLGHAVSRALSAAYRGDDLTISEWRVLAVVAQDAAMAARDVVAMTPMDKMAVSRAVSSLERKGLVERGAAAGDRRVAALGLTERGRALFDRIAAVAVSYERDLLSVLEPDEARVFDRAMRKLERYATTSAQEG